ncbi:Replication factor-A protein 1 [Spraguea lophii 42_110]|uniref:Replication protein A subunit n=1 Tax=Spraguea lophii (strain 42_110) TaxID=1358809 RepID=S7XLN4_SPRLO|nr:Replication factor-A protein 1 [Spraguea lophii 42_110]
MKLEQGTVEVIYNNNVESPLFNTPVLQIIAYKRVETKTDKSSRYHLNLSDGKYYIKAVMSSTISPMMEKNIKINSMIKIKKFQLLSKNDNNFVYVRELECYEDCNRKMGDPTPVSKFNSDIRDVAPSENNDKNKYVEIEKENTVEKKKIEREEVVKNRKVSHMDITSVSSINPFQTKWKIKATVTTKSDIRYFTNQKGEGKLFSMEMADNSGSIKVVAFSESVDIFYPLMDVGKTYIISKGFVKMAHKQFSNTTSNYEIHLDKNSEVELTAEVENPKVHYNFTKVGALNTTNPIVDIIGVVKEVFAPSTVMIKSVQKEAEKKDFILVDKTGSVRVTLWNNLVETELDNNPVVALKNMRATEYNGVSLSTISSSSIVINPELEEAYELRGWYEEEGKDIKIVLPKREEESKTIEEVTTMELEYSTIISTIIFIKEDLLWYSACVECNKKVELEGEGQYRCERCNNLFDKCNFRFMVTMNVADHTGQIWLTLFDEQATKLFKHTANELKEIGEEDSTKLQSIVKNLNNKELVFKIRRREENYNNELKVRYNGLNIEELDYIKESYKILKKIDN